MKNKKLFAILTLVCFMFTLMPVAAFAAADTTIGTIVYDDCLYVEFTYDSNPDDVEFVLLTADKEKLATLTYVGEEGDGADVDDKAPYYIGSWFPYADMKAVEDKYSCTYWVPTTAKMPATVQAYVDGKLIGESAIYVATTDGAQGTLDAEEWAEFEGVIDIATAGNIDDATSTFVAEDGDQTVKIDEEVVFELDVEDKAYNPAAGTVFIWAEEVTGKASSALNVVGGETTGISNVYAVEVENYADVKVSFSRAGEYTVYAAPFVNIKDADTNEVTELSKFDCDFSVIKVKSSSVDPEDAYRANGEKADAVIDSVNVTPNNVFEEEVTVVFTNDGQPMKGKTIAIDTNSASIEVSKDSAKTNSQGKISFAIAGSVEGTYEVILSVDGAEWTIKVVVGNTDAAYIKTVTTPSAPQALYDALANDAIEFVITDINGNVVNDDVVVDKTGTVIDANGMDGIYGVDGKDVEKYIVLTEAPADSDLESDDFTIAFVDSKNVWKLVTPAMDAEGDYTVKVILDNGAYATASWTVKKFQTPVRLTLGYSTTTVELGGDATAKLRYIDANGVQKLAKDAEFAATGYAVESATSPMSGYGKVVVKSDEKYVGSKINVTAVSDKYDLVGNAVLTVAEGASEIKFVDTQAEVNVNNKLEWNVVDGSGNRVALGAGVTVESVKYVVLDKPADAKVSVSSFATGDLNAKGIAVMSLTSDTVGNVTVQAILKVRYDATTGEDDMQVKYYTGTAVIGVGTDSVGDVVVMSIGSNQIVKNDTVATMAAAPLVQNDRTFVPFRALSEAFGATVAWDEATQSVTAELNGVKVVLTIGSAAYTVNGVEKTADVAPFINGASTMVPVRFVAEAFGIKVIPTYDENGATADILFNL